MIKEFKRHSHLKVNVVMKTGKEYTGCNMKSNAIIDGRFFSFWLGEALRMVPIEDISYIDIYEDLSE